MTVVDATTIIGAIATVIGSLFIPPYLARRKAKKEETADSDISMVNLNRAIVSDRDHWQSEAKAKDVEIERLEAKHAADLETEREAHRVQVAELLRKLDECQKQVHELYRQMYELQRSRPPGDR